jgi:hypothetical protein
MTQRPTLAVAPRLWRLFAFWLMFQVVLVAVAFGRSRGSLERALPFLVIGCGTLFAACALGGVLYYRSLGRLRDRGILLEGEVVPGRRRSIYWVKFSYDGVEYKRRVGMVVDFDMSVRKTLESAVAEKRPVRLLIDSAKPTRYLVLPFDGSATQQGSRPDPAK